MKANPHIVFRIRDPDTGLFLGPKASVWTDANWGKVGANYTSFERARAIVEHYVFNTADRATPLEIVEFQLAEVNASPVVLPPLTDMRTFTQHANEHFSSGGKPLWHSLASVKTMFSLAMRAVVSGRRPRYVATLSGKHSVVDPLNLNAIEAPGEQFQKPRTNVVMFDDAAMVALKLSHNDDIVQLWSFEGELLKGTVYYR